MGGGGLLGERCGGFLGRAGASILFYGGMEAYVTLKIKKNKEKY